MPKRSCIFLMAAALLAASPLADVPPARAAAPAGPAVPGALDGAAEAPDLSPEREAHYTRAVRQWLETLPPVQQAQARKILQEAHPGVHALRERIREKKAQLAALSFDSATPPDTLPRLGQELQLLREQLRRRLILVNEQLRNEVGVPMGPLREDGFWLNPPFEDQTPGAAPVLRAKPRSDALPAPLRVSATAAAPVQR